MSPGMIKLEAYAVALVIMVVALWGWGQHKEKQGEEKERAVWQAKQGEAAQLDMKSLKDAVQQSIALAQGTANIVAGIKVVNVTRQGVLEREIQTNTIYSNDCLPDTGIVQWNAISAGKPVVPSSSTGQQPDQRGAELPKGNVSTTIERKSGNAPVKPR